MATDRPLVTLAILAYNQAPYVESAMRAAFSQTYSPLEILVSDDASKDATPARIRAMAEGYDGPHRLRINLNPQNLGVGAHVNKLFEMASGELLVLAAADDLSHPGRVERLVQAWRTQEPQPWALHSSARVIDEAGHPLGRYVGKLRGHENDVEMLIRHYRGALLLGATTAYDMRLHERFGPLRQGLPVEDVPLTVRAAMLGRVAYLDDVLVDYRVGVHGWIPHGGKSTTLARQKDIRRFKARIDHAVAEQILADATVVGRPDVLALAQARVAETTYAADVAASGRLAPSVLWRTIRRSGRVMPALGMGALLSSDLLERLLFLINKFRPVRDTRVFQSDAPESDSVES
jgi:hypothetical protein